jgi:hypothetical protein
MKACASATVAAPLACVADDWLDDAWLDDALLDDFDAVFFGAVCASAVQAANNMPIADRTTNDLQIQCENIAPPVGQ